MTNTLTIQPLKPSEIALAARDCIEAGRSMMFHGDPGVGKSEIKMQVADLIFAEQYGCAVQANGDVTIEDVKQFNQHGVKHGVQDMVLRENERPWFNDFRLALRDAVDLTGVPYTVEVCKGVFVTKWAKPDNLPKDPRGGVWFFDEANRGSDQVRNAAMQVLTTGQLGDYTLPSGWVCTAAVNDKDIGASKMSAAFTRRFLHYDVVSDLDDVCRFAINRGWEPVIPAFLRMFPQHLNAFDPKERVGPNPRAWSYISAILGRGQTNNRVMHAHLAGTLGEALAVEFGAFLRLYKNLPSIDAIMLNPKKADVPTDVGAIYAISAALARRAKPANFGRILDYMERLPKEYSVYCVKYAVLADSTLQHTPEFGRWAISHQDVTF